jgi:ABC-type amino acid transport substrate-binding protein
LFFFVTAAAAVAVAVAAASASAENAAPAQKSVSIESRTIERIRSSGEIRVGHRPDAKPYSFRDGNNVTGYTVDVCRRVIERVQKRLGLKTLTPRFVAIDLQSRFDKLNNGEIDVECGSSVSTRSTQARVETSYWVLVTGVKILVKPRDNASEPLHAWLKRKKIAVCAKCANRPPIPKIPTLIGWDFFA